MHFDLLNPLKMAISTMSCTSSSVFEAIENAISAVFCSISASGYTKPLFRAEMEDREEISRTIALHYTLLQSKAEMDQLKQG